MKIVPGLDRLPAHRTLLDRAVSFFRDDDRVAGMILGGSLAHGAVDFYSDVDLYIVARDESFETVFDERDVAAGSIDTPLFRFDADPIPGGSQDYIVTYPGPIKLDLMYYRESDIGPDQKWIGCSVMKDHSGSLGAVVSRSAGCRPDRPEQRELLVLNQKFWTLCWYVFGKIMRGELWEALDAIHAIRSDVLLPLLDWTAGSRHEGYRRLERKLDPETAARLAATLARLETGALYEALQAAIALFRALREPVFDLSGLTYEPAVEEVIQVEMSRRWAERES